MEINSTILAQVEDVDWLSSCGQDSPLSREMYLRQVTNWSAATASYDEEWISIKREIGNEMSQLLATQHPSLFRQWNTLVDSARTEVKRRLNSPMQEIVARQGIDSSFTDVILADIYMYLVEYTYAEQDCVVPIFYRNLFQIYQAGHFPCGWGGGQFPEGYQWYY